MLLLEATQLGATARKTQKQPLEGPGAAAFASSAEAAMTLVFLQAPGPSAEEQQFPGLTSRGTASANSPLTVISSDPLAGGESSDLDRDDQADASVDAGDPAERVRLFGVYAGQIDARIERAWRRPRSPINTATAVRSVDLSHAEAIEGKDERFECRVRIYQGESGHVREVELLNCNGTLDWQQSLVRAIQAASPLPAPPTPGVFTNVITLKFTANAYRAGVSDAHYESESEYMRRNQRG